MSWAPRSPRPPDFCGHPPCPRCFVYLGGPEPGPQPADTGVQESLYFLAKELMGGAIPGDDEIAAAKAIGERLHAVGVQTPDEPEQQPPGGAAIDIGMSFTRRMELTVRVSGAKTKPAEQKARVLTCDEVVARQQEREARAKLEKEEKAKRTKEIKEVAAAFAEATPQQGRQREPLDMEYLCGVRGIPRSFVLDVERRRGSSVTNEYVMQRWEEYQGMRQPSYFPGRYGE